MAACPYTFHSMAAADLPTVRRWLAMPHVAEWWGDPDEQFGLVSDDLHHPAMNQFIVAHDDRPFAYLQCYDPLAWPQHGFGKLTAGTRGIDQFIGETNMIGQGHGSALIRSFVDDLLARGAPRVVTDPSPQNARAIRAYEKAGFHRDHPVQTPNGPALLMARDA
jgi:aminoglycoside 6'-N-acetyltransferase